MIHFSTIKEMLPEKTRTALLVDSSNGVLTNGFLDRAFGTDPDHEGVWGIWENVPGMLVDALAGDADDLAISVFSTLADAHPDTRFGQITAAYDSIQSLILMFMQGVDDGTYNPFVSPDDQEILTAALFEFSPSVRWSMNVTSWLAPRNYRFYLAAGSGHVALLDPAEGFVTTNFFAEQSARGIALRDWVDDMINNPRRAWWRTDWRNLSCFPDCLQLPSN